DWIRDLVTAFEELGKGALLAVQIIAGAFNGLVAVLNPVAELLNQLFGTKFTGQSLAIATVILYMVGAFSALGAVLAVVGAALGVVQAIFIAMGVTTLSAAIPVAILIGLLIGIAYGIIVNWTTIKDV